MDRNRSSTVGRTTTRIRSRLGFVLPLAVVASLFVVGTETQIAQAGTFPNLLNNNITGGHSPMLIANLYWDTNWDGDNAGVLPTMGQLNDFTSTMYTSGYLSGLAQYGVNVGPSHVPPGPGPGFGFLGGFQANSDCKTAPSSIGYTDLSSFVLCMRHDFHIDGYNPFDPGTYGARVIYMVYTPASTSWGGGGCPSWDGFHALTLPSIIPPDLPQYFGFVLSGCTGETLDGMTSAGSHEAVEAATDPIPILGWIDNDAFSSVSVSGVTNLLTAGEAADLCDSHTNTPVDQPPLNLPAPIDGTMSGGAQPYQVAFYWSNAAGACVLPQDNDLAVVPATGTTVDATSPAGAVVNYTPPTATDEGGATVSCDHSPGDLFPIGTTIVSCTATATDGDDVLSPIAFSFSVTVNDTDATLVGVPADITVDATGTTGAVVTYVPPTLSDEDPAPPPVSCDTPSGSTFPIGTTTVTCFGFTDEATSPVTASFNVTVLDTDLALSGVPADITVDATSPSGATVTYAPPTAVDEDPTAPVVSCDHPSGSTFPIGVTPVTCTALDPDDLNSASATFTVTVRDTDLALAGVPANITVDATSPSGATVTYVPPVAVDEDATVPTVTCDHASGATYPIGTTTVTCSVSDPDDLNGTQSASFTVHVKGAAEQLNDLLSFVRGLPPGHSLAAKVDAAIASLAAGNVRAACQQLTALIHEATAQSGKHLTAAQAAAIITAAQRIRAVLGC